MNFQPIPEAVEEMAKTVIDLAFLVHRKLGLGLLESVYEICLCHELKKAGYAFARQVSLPVQYDNLKLDAGLRLDLLVADELIVEYLLPVHKAQLMTYLQLTQKRLGLLINFNVSLIRDGIQRVVL